MYSLYYTLLLLITNDEGLNREYFIPFINRLELECVVKDIGGTIDYRFGNDKREGSYFRWTNNVLYVNL